ncbi:MAG: hypothetical protein IJG13_00605 [Kiritimatiellae bacterium]|nr:hypothetical protein [Kiritimatiellia bacterium]MBQ3345206.1 hypothetical protein [Kiritimatiellia bacterium]MBQ6329990.1 hypothetical protein [Kiritimatiellia bacterium]
MTKTQKEKCHYIIHSHAAAAGGGNVVPIPGVGIAADTAAMVSMAISLALVFGQNIPKSTAKVMAVDALKKTLLKQPLKVITKELGKLVPFLGSAFAATVSAGLIEAAGWALVNDFEDMAA